MDERAAERRARWGLFVASLLVYAWFFQGDGFNQNAHFDTVRALVERRTFAITDYARAGEVGYTGDVSVVGGRVYSSKPPGLAVICAPFYAAVRGVERATGVDETSPRVVRINQYLTTIWGSAVPAALLVVAMYGYFLRRGMAAGDAMLLAAAFAFGSLLLPYS